MTGLEELLAQTNIDSVIITVRLILGFILGTLVGLEREWRGQPAGLKTHILICTGATLMVMLSLYIPQICDSGDPSRIASHVIAGIGFLGAGAIWKLGATIKGVTTAASIWFVAGIGLATGAGMYAGAVLCTLAVLFVFTVVNIIEGKIFKISVTQKKHRRKKKSG